LEIDNTLGNLVRAVQILEDCEEFSDLIPEVRVNLVMALPDAKSEKDVAAIPGRITRVFRKPVAVGQPALGGSSHMARVVLQVMKHDPSMRAAMNVKYDEEIIRILREEGLNPVVIDRKEEPPEIKMQEGKTSGWLVEKASGEAGGLPGAICDKGDFGKEPLILLIGRNAVEVAQKATKIAKRYGGK